MNSAVEELLFVHFTSTTFWVILQLVQSCRTKLKLSKNQSGLKLFSKNFDRIYDTPPKKRLFTKKHVLRVIYALTCICKHMRAYASKCMKCIKETWLSFSSFSSLIQIRVFSYSLQNSKANSFILLQITNECFYVNEIGIWRALFRKWDLSFMSCTVAAKAQYKTQN